MKRTVAVVTLGCARNEVDSEELAGRLAADGWTLVDDVESAEVALVNTCGFIESAKKDSVDALLEANSLKGHGVTRAVVAVGCMAERYGKELAEALPEADAILGFDDYKDISARLQAIIAGESHKSHVPRDRRALLPIAPVDRADARESEEFSRKRLGTAPWAPLKIASGCDRRCSFCAIPYFRGSFVSRRPTLIQAMIATDKTAPYFDLSFQHTSPTVLRRMRRFGDSEKFLHLISQVRAVSPEAGIRSNFIVGFPGETQEDFDDLADFITKAKLDAVGVFGYSDEDNTEALDHSDKIDADVIAQRVETLSSLADEMVSLRAQARIGENVRVLIEDEELQEGRAAHQGPEVDGTTSFIGTNYKVGQYVDAVVIDSMGADLVAQPL